MTTLGKLFVYIQFVLSMTLLAIVGVGIYPHRINPKAEQMTAGGEKVPSILQKLDDRIKELGGGRDRAETRWLLAWQDLRMKETIRPARLDSFNEKLLLTRTGMYKGQKILPSVTTIEYDPANGKVKIPGGTVIRHRPQDMKFGEDALCYTDIATTLNNFHRNEMRADGPPVLGYIPQKQADIRGQLTEYDRLTVAILGDPPGTGGLRRQRELQEEAKKRALVEQENLKPFLANRYSEAVLALKRQNSLLSRKQELEKIGVAASDAPPK